MFFIGVFSNIIPVIVLCVVSLGLYINGNDQSFGSINEAILISSNSYELLDRENTEATQKTSETDLIKESRKQFLNIERPKSDFTNLVKVHLACIHISPNNYRGSPIL